MTHEQADVLRARLRDRDVPDDVRELVARLLDHTTRCEQTIILVRGALGALANAPDFAIMERQR